MPEGCIDEPPLPVASPDCPPVPRPGVLGLPVEIEMPDVACFEIDGLAVVRTQDRDACERSARAIVLRTRLEQAASRRHPAGEDRRADHREPTMLHERMLPESDTAIYDRDPSKYVSRRVSIAKHFERPA